MNTLNTKREQKEGMGGCDGQDKHVMEGSINEKCGGRQGNGLDALGSQGGHCFIRHLRPHLATDTICI
ncbi:hypothetical protein E2C01_042974 [Portunus trituberculatus]|uniref:Uncharacterized protein n=1 Tax=Portunus trituberculatus TaxID=210409 RepID=A0A5B7FV29_PORTR|nr:hypothetical protein [Portunus trituberculatus]